MNEFYVEAEVLKVEAGVWDAQSSTLSSAGNSASDLFLKGMQAGVFFPIQSLHNEVSQYLSARCQEGSIVVGEIATALRKNASQYIERDLDEKSDVEEIDVEDGY